MIRIVRLGFVLPALLFSLVARGSDPAESSTTQHVVQRDSSTGPNNDLPKDVERLLWWLPEDMDSLMVSRGCVPIDRFPCEMPPKSQPMGSVRAEPVPHRFADLVAAECIGPLSNLCALYPAPAQGRMVKSFFTPKNTSLFCKAARWGASETPQVCDMVIFRDATAERMLASLAEWPNASSTVEGVRILTVDTNNGTIFPPILRYLASPLPQVFVATTSKELMKEIVARVKTRGINRAFPKNLPEWREVRSNSPAWAIRHYRGEATAKKLTSMRGRDSGASGLVLFCGDEPTPFVSLRYISTSEDASNRFIRMRADWLGGNPEAFSEMKRCDINCVEERLRINVSKVDALRDNHSMTIEATDGCVFAMYLPLLGFCR